MRARGPSAALSKSHAQHSGDLGLLSLRQPPRPGSRLAGKGCGPPLLASRGIADRKGQDRVDSQAVMVSGTAKVA